MYAVKVVVQVRGGAKVLGISPDIVQDSYNSFTCRPLPPPIACAAVGTVAVHMCGGWDCCSPHVRRLGLLQSTCAAVGTVAVHMCGL